MRSSAILADIITLKNLLLLLVISHTGSPDPTEQNQTSKVCSCNFTPLGNTSPCMTYCQRKLCVPGEYQLIYRMRSLS